MPRRSENRQIRSPRLIRIAGRELHCETRRAWARKRRQRAKGRGIRVMIFVDADQARLSQRCAKCLLDAVLVLARRMEGWMMHPPTPPPPANRKAVALSPQFPHRHRTFIALTSHLDVECVHGVWHIPLILQATSIKDPGTIDLHFLPANIPLTPLRRTWPTIARCCISCLLGPASRLSSPFKLTCSYTRPFHPSSATSFAMLRASGTPAFSQVWHAGSLGCLPCTGLLLGQEAWPAQRTQVRRRRRRRRPGSHVPRDA
ncbi:hypothetical protein LZ32DRAFT_304908 [Colletotrichum eremochloae]|nr:hypothetical protein LZ32DRAFT_304908 [Colletotrichum eremochloae]